ncbi:hypothetical protein [Sinomonas sp. P47F7]|uniref:hypothetical protein n=1 Tax=Sinomonas sp. P47F7 TaxID=3410987 RepID=UPI003BF5646F
MKFRLNGREYDIEAALQRPTLLMLREMKIRTGYGIKSIRDAAPKFQDLFGGAEGLSEEEKEDLFMEVVDDPDFLGVFIAVIWLARRHAGENLTFEEAGDFDIDSLEVVDDEPDPKDGPEPDLPAPEPEAARPGRSSTSRTSKRASSRTSS